MGEPREETERKIREILEAHPALADRIARQLLILLHNRGVAPIDRIYDESGYPFFIYAHPPNPPLTGEDDAWARSFLPPPRPTAPTEVKDRPGS